MREHIGKQQHLKLNIIWFIHKMLEKCHKNGFDQQIEGKAERCHEWECRIWLKHLIMDCNPHPGTKTPCSKYQLLVGALKCRRSHFSAQLKWSDSAFVTTTGRVPLFLKDLYFKSNNYYKKALFQTPLDVKVERYGSIYVLRKNTKWLGNQGVFF